MLECNQCGKCCRKYADGGLAASAQDIAWWEASRPDIARYVSNGEIWTDPLSGQRLTSCPFLTAATDLPPSHRGTEPGPAADSTATIRRRYRCSIYNDRPEDCRQYPVSINDMVVDECEMLEVRDLRDPASSQRKLDRLMQDHRRS